LTFTNISSKLNIMRMKYRILLLAFLFSSLSFSIWLNARGSVLGQTPPLPAEGWRVCQDLGVGVVPGLSEERQRFVLCNNPPGWEVQVYCLDPGSAPPDIGTNCSLLGDNIFWCGDSVQQLQLYGILQIPPTATASATATATLTATATSLPPSATPLPSQTQPAATRTSAPRPTATARVAPGGPGNLAQIYAGAIVALAVLMAGIVLFSRLTRRS
jgi:hypothetical protein